MSELKFEISSISNTLDSLPADIHKQLSYLDVIQKKIGLNKYNNIKAGLEHILNLQLNDGNKKTEFIAYLKNEKSKKHIITEQYLFNYVVSLGQCYGMNATDILNHMFGESIFLIQPCLEVDDNLSEAQQQQFKDAKTEDEKAALIKEFPQKVDFEVTPLKYQMIINDVSRYAFAYSETKACYVFFDIKKFYELGWDYSYHYQLYLALLVEYNSLVEAIYSFNEALTNLKKDFESQGTSMKEELIKLRDQLKKYGVNGNNGGTELEAALQGSIAFRDFYSYWNSIPTDVKNNLKNLNIAPNLTSTLENLIEGSLYQANVSGKNDVMGCVELAAGELSTFLSTNKNNTLLDTKILINNKRTELVLVYAEAKELNPQKWVQQIFSDQSFDNIYLFINYLKDIPPSLYDELLQCAKFNLKGTLSYILEHAKIYLKPIQYEKLVDVLKPYQILEQFRDAVKKADKNLFQRLLSSMDASQRMTILLTEFPQNIINILFESDAIPNDQKWEWVCCILKNLDKDAYIFINHSFKNNLTLVKKLRNLRTDHEVMLHELCLFCGDKKSDFLKTHIKEILTLNVPIQNKIELFSDVFLSLTLEDKLQLLHSKKLLEHLLELTKAPAGKTFFNEHILPLILEEKYICSPELAGYVITNLLCLLNMQQKLLFLSLARPASSQDNPPDWENVFNTDEEGISFCTESFRKLNGVQKIAWLDHSNFFYYLLSVVIKNPKDLQYLLKDYFTLLHEQRRYPKLPQNLGNMKINLLLDAVETKTLHFFLNETKFFKTLFECINSNATFNAQDSELIYKKIFQSITNQKIKSDIVNHYLSNFGQKYINNRNNSFYSDIFSFLKEQKTFPALTFFGSPVDWEFVAKFMKNFSSSEILEFLNRSDVVEHVKYFWAKAITDINVILPILNLLNLKDCQTWLKTFERYESSSYYYLTLYHMKTKSIDTVTYNKTNQIIMHLIKKVDDSLQETGKNPVYCKIYYISSLSYIHYTEYFERLKEIVADLEKSNKGTDKTLYKKLKILCSLIENFGQIYFFNGDNVPDLSTFKPAELLHNKIKEIDFINQKWFEYSDDQGLFLWFRINIIEPIYNICIKLNFIDKKTRPDMFFAGSHEKMMTSLQKDVKEILSPEDDSLPENNNDINLIV